MKKNKIWLYLFMAIIGALSFYIGGFVLVEEKLKALSGLCIGLGAAVFCLGIGNFISALIILKTENEEFTRKKNIEVNDERNTRIREKVGAKINQVVIYALSVIVLAMGFMQINIIAIIMVASVFLVELVLAIVLSNYYSKRM
ncbi:hypothetical protein OBV_44730 [Oscillibacter valericigenes Sjm18-20]|nr:hypothetical protein OBV_44730 [Oscillibacter valericigenes Sjm18-20]